MRKRAWRSRIAPQVTEEALEECTDVSGSDMVERVVKEEERVHLWKAVDGLPDVYRIPILLYCETFVYSAGDGKKSSL